MDDFREIVKDLSYKYKTVYVNTQIGFDRYLEDHSSYSISDDKVHPNLIGHKIIANSFLEAIGFEIK